MFDGKYHGHFDEALVELDDDGRARARGAGRPGGHGRAAPSSSRSTTSAALARALERRDIALVLTEPAITNNIGLLLPDDGFHAALRRLTRETGTLLASTRRTPRSSARAGSSASGASSPTSSRPASRSPAGCRSGRGA